MTAREDAVIITSLVRQALTSMQEVMGEHGLNAVLKSCDLEKFIGNFPPNDLEPSIKASQYAQLNQAIEDFYGRGGKGMLRRMAYGSGHEGAKALVGEVLGKLGVGPAALFSTLGRTAGRGIETMLLADRMDVWLNDLITRVKAGETATFNGERWDPSTWPAEADGYGYLDAPRGALRHWVRIKNGKVARYQCVVPSTWNCSPRDGKGQMGPYEAALTDNHPLADPARPIEILRTIHSFDPCMACGVHVLDATGKLLTEVRVQ